MRILCILIAILFVGAAHGREIKMTLGSDTFVFDDALYGSSFSVFTAEGEPPGGEIQELVAHQMFRLEDILGGVPEVRNDFVLGIALMQNGYAVIHSGERYIVMDPNWFDKAASRALVLAHEVGHHVCGHTEGGLRDQPWEKELEADEFAGFVLRRAVDNSSSARHPLSITLEDAISWAPVLYSTTPSPTHPPGLHAHCCADLWLQQWIKMLWAEIRQGECASIERPDRGAAIVMGT